MFILQSLISYPCDYRVVTLNDDMSLMSIATNKITSVSGHPEFTSNYAKTRLHTSIYNIVKAKAEAKAGADLPARAKADGAATEARAGAGKEAKAEKESNSEQRIFHYI